MQAVLTTLKKKLNYSLEIELENRVAANEHQYNLLETLFKTYRKEIRPVKNLTTVTHVEFKFFVNLVLDMDEKHQKLTSNTWITLTWIDEYMVWSPTKYGGIDNIKLQADNLWLPDVYFYQNAANKYENFLENAICVIYYTGEIIWSAPVIFSGHCRIDTRYFPFDRQQCVMKFGTWQHDGTEVALNGSGDTSAFVTNGEWDLHGLHAENNVEYYPDTPGIPYTDVTFTIDFQRRSLFYVFNLLMPCTLISLMTVLTFFLPAESQGKISLGVTVLLSLTVFLLLVAEVMPAADEVPIIGQYYASTMILISISLGMNVLVVNIYYRGPDRDSGPVPKWANKFITGYLAWILNVNVKDECKTDRSSPESVPLIEVNCNSHHGGTSTVNVLDPRDRLLDGSPLPSLRRAYHMHADGGYPSINDCGMNKDDKEQVILLRMVLRELRVMTAVHDRQKIIERAKTEWKRMARVMDRLCLLIYVIGTVSTVLVSVCQIPW
uniref:Neuronal acetylcholine receptor subunit alpha-9-like n=1 Tax=Saccoglossus kowalevskii TaxID=10224 RepID=A0ABM0N123_SACKO|nr:PREDICTED: neuronal acetylcholine receptor subunit alpha-9-like [Saccoglossus kowalevskii]